MSSRELVSAFGAAMQANDVHCLVADGATVVSEVTVTDGGQSARAVVFSEVGGEQIAHQVEYWPTAYEPLPGRAD